MSEALNVWYFVVGAYAVTWAALLGYSLRLWVLTRRARERARSAGGRA